MSKPFIQAVLLSRAEPEWVQEEKHANGVEVENQVLRFPGSGHEEVPAIAKFKMKGVLGSAPRSLD